MKRKVAVVVALLLFFAFVFADETYNKRDIEQAANCWTCPPGFSHWFNLGYSTPTNGDPCQCIWGTAPTTSKPAPAPTSCWTCPSGFSHWWKLGYSAPTNGDQCQCLPGSAATTKAPTSAPTTPSSTPSCWTCPPGQAHWFVLGLPRPTDQCACYQTSTTKAPTAAPTPSSTPSCWTCPAGQKHWWELGMAKPTDQCACFPTTAATTARPSNCWTCPAGQSHWFDIGFTKPTNGDPCQCIPSTIATTSASPIATPKCWTCPPGYSHWWDQGFTKSQNGDECQCMPIPSPSAPLSEAMISFLKYMTPTDSSPGSISFSPIVAPYSPWNLPPYTLMETLLVNIIKTTNFRTIMTYGLTTNTAALARKYNIKVLGIIMLINDNWTNSKAIADGIAAANAYPDVVIAVACGNEFGLTYGTGASSSGTINSCLTQVKAGGVKQPLGVVDVYQSWNQNGNRWSAIYDNIEWLGVNTYPWYDNTYAVPPFTCSTPSNVGAATLLSFTRLENLYGGKPVVLTEYGWPGGPAGSSIPNPPNVYTGISCGIGSDAAQREAVQNILSTFRANKKPCNLFSGYREAWKGSNEEVEMYWGVCSGSPPYACYNAPK